MLFPLIYWACIKGKSLRVGPHLTRCGSPALDLQRHFWLPASCWGHQTVCRSPHCSLLILLVGGRRKTSALTIGRVCVFVLLRERLHLALLIRKKKKHFCLISVLIRLPLFYKGCHGFKLQTGLATTPAEQMYESVIQSEVGDKNSTNEGKWFNCSIYISLNI